ncbi:hypothetical protein G9A89_020218 [Geosiphon pyriformis]|nr:hypothetical protein G9A89_020218 [Geosiphon pyriformis]
MANTIAKETSYAESGEDDNMDETTPRKIRTQTFTLGNPLKWPSFECISDDNVVLNLPPYVNIGSNQSLSLGSRVLKIRNFNTTKFFVLDIELSAVPGNLNKAREMAICEKILVNNDVKKANSHSD